MSTANVLRPEKSIRFGDFELNATTAELHRGRRIVKLERIPLQVLLILIEENGKVVTREAIADQIWGKDVFVDVDNGINTAIRKVRQVLKDDPQRPRFVETIPGMGYRFIGTLVETQPSDGQNGLPAKPESEPEDRGRDRLRPFERHVRIETGQASGVRVGQSRYVAWRIGLLCVIGIAGWLGWRHFNPPGGHRAIHSIAVLPLQNLSGDSSQDFFSDGMTEELITELSRIQSLRVVSHTSVRGYKGTMKHLPQIAQELGVDAILEGSVIRENNQVRVTVQLLNGPEDRHLWSEAYERPLNGVLNLQRDVARAIAEQIRIKLTPEEQVRFNSAQSVDPHAFEQYLQGRYLLSTQFTLGPPLFRAKELFEGAIQKDSSFAEAYSGLADAHLYLAIFRQEAPDAAFRSAHEALQKAMELDNSIGEIHDTLGVINWRRDWNWANAEGEFDRAIAVAPSYSCAHEDRAEYLAFVGRRDEALAEVTKINALDLGPSAQMTEAGVFYQLRDYPGLVETARKGVELDPNEWVEHQFLGFGYEETGKLPEAIAQYQKAVSLSNGDQDATASLVHAYAVSGDRALARKALQDWEMKSGGKVLSPYLMAAISAGFGERDKAFEYLDQAYRERSLELSWYLKADPRLDSLRSDPRFQSLWRQIAIPVQR